MLNYRLTPLAKWCVIITGLFMCMEVAFAYHSYRFHDFLQRVSGQRGGYLSDAEMEQAAISIDQWGLPVGIGYLVVFVIAVILNGMWIYRASFNASELSQNPDRMSPGWAVGFYFVPILNLWKPLTGMKEIWNTTMRPDRDHTANAPTLLGWWWACWLIMNILGNISLRMSQKEDLDSLITSTQLDLASAPFALVTAWLLIQIITTITKEQDEQNTLKQDAEHNA